jgi:hypothetical protein
VYLAIQLLVYGMTLIRANTLAFGLIGKDGPHRIIKICFGNMNLVFGSEVALLGFWKYIFGILLTVQSFQIKIKCTFLRRIHMDLMRKAE